MTSFKALFKQMFGQKRRYADLVLLLQVFAVLFLLVMALWDKSNFVYLNIDKNSNWLDYILSAGMITTLVADVIFLGPNMFSSFVECIYIFIIQVVLGFLVAMADNLSHHLPLLHAMIDSKFNWSDFSPVIEFLLFLSGLVLVIFTFVSFANFLTRAIVDQLPFNNNILIKLFVMALIVIIAVLIAGKLNDQITTMYLRHLAKENDLFGVSTTEYFAGAIVLGVIDSYLISKLVEPKIVSERDGLNND